MVKIGITERGDAGLDLSWVDKLDEVDGAILVTKFPTPPFVKLLEEFQDKLIAHITITGYGGTKIEPNVPKSDKVFFQFRKVLDILGSRKTVLRIDPIIPTPHGIDVAYKVFFESLDYPNHRLRISIMDNYFHVNRRFVDAGLPSFDYRFHAGYERRAKIISHFGDTAKICGEPGFPSEGCVSYKDLDALGIPHNNDIPQGGQRRACTCLNIKTELLSNKKRCPYKCLYCYWKD